MEDSRQVVVNNPSSVGHTLNKLLPLSRVIIHMMLMCEFVFQTPLAAFCHRHPECSDFWVIAESREECCSEFGAMATSIRGYKCKPC